ncbi:ISL3 family transposase [Kibdelosporangium aridum]|uniref:ISL3 family transposase n=1 Tax=Kibdelosporangium aridum TaxID=2030 RepID=A0A428Z0I3_KIBAR|nr:ISL3 family transposase [Kibdelosporangium aridum]RSM77815.1 ISL3 family transposase [Kibdelosporangium aridum]
MVRIEARTSGAPAACPDCGLMSGRVHSRYNRHLSDTATAGREVLVRLTVRRLFCDNPDCARTTFAEQVPELAARHARRTTILQRMLGAVALALGGRAGARLTQRLAASVSRMTLLRMLRGLPDPDRATPRVLGVDDFALRRGHHYGTLLIDMESRLPVDVLTDRTAQTLSEWLRAHPGVEIVCRDRAGAYAEGAREGAPNAVQVADRWHVWNNLADAVERTVARHKDCLALAAALAVQIEHDVDNDETQLSDSQLDLDANPPLSPSTEPSDRTDRWAVRARERHAAVHTLLAEGVGINAICRRLDLARGTVRRFARAETVEELLTRNGTGRRPSLLDEFKPYLHERWNAGCTNASALLAEITARGYRGGSTLIRQYLHQFRTTARVPQPPRTPPSVRRVVGWIMTDPKTMDSTDQQRMDAILAASPHLNALTSHVRAFATMMCSLRGQNLEAWMTAIDADDQPALRSFVVGLRRDQDAVTAGLTLPWNSGPVEGHVNRIKMLKRQMFGRAKPDLLRKRVLLTD